MPEVFIIYETKHFGMNEVSRIDSIYANYEEALKVLKEKNLATDGSSFVLTKEPVLGTAVQETAVNSESIMLLKAKELADKYQSELAAFGGMSKMLVARALLEIRQHFNLKE